MTRICLIIDGHKFAEIRDGVIWGIRSLGWLYEQGIRPDDFDMVQNIQELKDKFCVASPTSQ